MDDSFIDGAPNASARESVPQPSKSIDASQCANLFETASRGPRLIVRESPPAPVTSHTQPSSLSNLELE